MERWQSIDFPVLKEIYRIQQATPPGADIYGDAIMETLGIEEMELKRSLSYLYDAGLVHLLDGDNAVRTDTYVIKGVTAPDGLRQLGAWPSDEQLARVLPEVLKELAEQSDDDTRATLLRRAGNVVEGVATASLVTLIRSVGGLM